VDAAYISFTDVYDEKIPVKYTEETHDDIIFDFAADGSVVGIEFLTVSKRFPQLLKGIANDVPRV
jgi:uncharacterized protein YuzE